MTEIQQLRQYAQQIREWQSRELLSDNDLLKQCGLLGSTKTYRRVLDPEDNLEGLDIERQLHQFTQQWVVIETRAAAGAGAEDDYDDLSHVNAARLAVTDALAEKGNNRLVIIEGPSGSGKTSLRRILVKRWPNVSTAVDADETWRESLTAMLSTLLIEVGPIERNKGEGVRSADVLIPYSAIEQKRKLFDALRVRKRILFMDEAHHMGVRTLNMVKSILNETPTVVVFLAIGTLLKRLEQNAYEEARQLTRNRLGERIVISSPAPDEVEKFVARRGVKFTDTKEAKNCAAKLAADAVTRGNWNFVNMVARKARKLCAKGPIDTEQFVEALTAALKTR
ncbi:MAG: ATP-binding protein [Acidobacteriota bacterium]